MKTILLIPFMFAFTITSFAQQIDITSISRDTLCNKGMHSISFNATGTFNTGNVFYLEISDITGSFANPIPVGYSTSSTTGPIIFGGMSGFPTGSGYRLRVNSSDPAVLGNDNGSDIYMFKVDTTVVSGPGYLEATTTFPGSTFQWIENEYSPIAGETDPMYYCAPAQGGYSVEVTQGGCVDTSMGRNPGVTNAMLELADVSPFIYPNPSNGLFKIDGQGKNAVFHVEVVNALGQVICSFEGEGPIHDIDLTGQKNGIYLVRLSQGGMQYVERIVKQ